MWLFFLNLRADIVTFIGTLKSFLLQFCFLNSVLDILYILLLLRLVYCALCC